jgi:hypothetical protein
MPCNRSTAPSAAALGLLAALMAGGCAHTTTIDLKGVDVVPIADLGGYLKAHPDPFADPAKRIAIRVPAGQPIPIEITLQLPFAELEGGSPAIRFRRDVYILIGKETMLVGFDGRRFAEIADLQGLKEVAGLERGALEIGFSVKEAEGAKIKIGLAGE